MPNLLDLFGGAGGAGEGYRRAGFTIIGIDITTHPDYPGEHHVMDWAEGLKQFGGWADVIHASPPCPRYSVATPKAARDKHPDLVGPVREALKATGKPYVIENVPGSPLHDPVPTADRRSTSEPAGTACSSRTPPWSRLPARTIRSRRPWSACTGRTPTGPEDGNAPTGPPGE